MITANHKPRFKRLFFLYLKHYLFKKHLGKIVVDGKWPDRNGPTLYIINHSAWWDGLILFYLIQSQSQKAHYVMMDEKGLRRYPFFRKIGAFSVNKDKPRDLMHTFNYMAGLMNDAHPVWVFPQGKVEHQDAVPYVFQKGLGRMMTLIDNIHVVPVTLHYAFLEEQKPVVSIQIGDAMAIDKKQASKAVWLHRAENMMSRQYNEQKQRIIDDIHFYERTNQHVIFASSRSTSDWLDSWKGRFKR